MPVSDAYFLFGMAHSQSPVEHDASRRAATVHKVDPQAEQIAL
jgi:hypothetical protein